MPGFHGQIVHTPDMTLVLWHIESGSVLPEHSHPNEQITYLLSGAFEMTVGGETKVCEAGSMVTIPPNILHYGEALSPVVLFDVFRPAREDFPPNEGIPE